MRKSAGDDWISWLFFVVLIVNLHLFGFDEVRAVNLVAGVFFVDMSAETFLVSPLFPPVRVPFLLFVNIYKHRESFVYYGSLRCYYLALMEKGVLCKRQKSCYLSPPLFSTISYSISMCTLLYVLLNTGQELIKTVRNHGRNASIL